MTTWRRLIGFVDDAVAGGSAYDDLVAGAIPAPTKFIPATTANVNDGTDFLDRANEVRGYRGSPPPVEFRANPGVPFTANAYPFLVKKLIRLWTGATDVRTGVPPAAITHKFQPIQSGELPAIHMAVVRDEQYDAVAGCTAEQITLDFPLAEFATIEAELRGKYRKREAGNPPAATYAEYPRRGYLLRDAHVLLGGSPTAIPGLRGIRFVLSNSMVEPPDYEPKRNRVVTTYGGKKRTVWWPARHKFMAHSLTGQLLFSTPQPDEDFKRELAHAEQLVFECEFEDISPATTPPAKEMLRVSGPQMVRTGGGPEALTDQDEITSSYDFGLYIDEATGADATFEFVDGSNVNIT